MADYNVYDLYVPSPPSLKQLVSMEVALILWRREIQLHITENGTLRERYPRGKTSLRCLLPEVPSTVLPLIEKYVFRLEWSIPYWLKYHAEEGILKFDVLNHFSDFVCDFYDGCIHYGRTAKRFVACDGVSSEVKFKMACEYCLEDDVLRIWPEVSLRMSAVEISSGRHPMLFYWVCRLKNELDEIVLYDGVSSVEELMLRFVCENESCIADGWPAVEYFFKCLPSDSKMKNMVYIAIIADIEESTIRRNLGVTFYRYILTKLNKAGLKKLVVVKGDELVIHSRRECFLRVWDYIKNEITNDGFCSLVEFMFREETDNPSTEDYTPHFRELWISTPDRLKQAAIRGALFTADSSCFDRQGSYVVNNTEDRRSVSFLSAVLSYASIEDRKTFWIDHWKLLTFEIKLDDLRVLMNLCFDDDENQITSFKNDVISQLHPEFYSSFEVLFHNGYLTELEDFLTFWCSNEQTIKDIRLKLLHKSFVIPIHTKHISKSSSLSEFIDKAYEDTDLAIEFKNELLVRPEYAVESLRSCIRSACFRGVIEFVDTFAPSKEFAAQFKTRELVPALKLAFTKGSYSDNKFEQFENFISWLFESSDGIARFKETLDMDAIIQKWIQERKNQIDCLLKQGIDYDWFDDCFQRLNGHDSGVKKFLEWYFATHEAYQMFVEKYAHDPIFYRVLFL